jgi:toxin YoeB
VTYKLKYTKIAVKDIQRLKAAKLDSKAIELCMILALDPRHYKTKQLCRNLSGKHSIRINLQHRIIYEILENEKIVKILSMWGHYE